jgi:sugar/nucleoside kinase (ribokinase family)
LESCILNWPPKIINFEKSSLNMSHYHLYAIGNALVDNEYKVTDDVLTATGVSKRHMTLIDAEQRTSLLKQLRGIEPHRTGGGSAGNTVVALAQLGGKAFYSCRVADDELGSFYRDDLQENQVATNLTHTKAPEGQTGNCLVLVTPDAERTMCTFLGATSELNTHALHPHDIARSKIYYMEGYLAASPTGLEAATEGRKIAKQHGALTALTLSDVSMINFCRVGLEAMIGGGLDYLFANEEEAQIWCETTDMEEIREKLLAIAQTVCLTLGPKGCVILHGEEIIHVEATPTKAVDTNGAGDMFAGAFLYGITHGMTPKQAAALANRAAATVVAQYGNRLTKESLQNILKRAL